MTWRDTWRETVESFLREVRDPDEGGAPPRVSDPVAAAIAAARAELADLERERAEAMQRAESEEVAASSCERRRLRAEQIGDVETARIAASFGRRHAARAEVLRRKREVLDDELRLARDALEDLLDYARNAGRER